MSSRRILTALATALLVLGGLALAARPAAAAPRVPAVAAAALPTCNILLEGQRRWNGSAWFVCVHVKGIGYFWIKESFYGCAPVRAARLC